MQYHKRGDLLKNFVSYYDNMVTYFCHRCGKFFQHKGTFKKHIFKAEICPPVVSNKNRLEIWDYYHLNTTDQNRFLNDTDMVIKKKKSKKTADTENTKNDEKTKNTEMNDVKMRDICEIIDKDGKVKYRCFYCGGLYTRKNNLISHIKKYCKATEEKKALILSSKNKQENMINLDELKKHLDDIAKNAKIVNNFTNNVQTNFFQLNAYGKENPIKISEEVLSKVIMNPMKGIPDLISMHHFNPSKPENQNIRYNGKRSFYVDVFNGNFWEAKDKGEVIHDMIVAKKDIADDFFDDAVEKNKVGDKIKDNYNSFSEKIDRYVNAIINELNYGKEIIEQDKELYKQLYKQVELMMINAQRILTLKGKNAPSIFQTIE